VTLFDDRFFFRQRDRAGQHSIRINDQFRVCFVWRADGVHDVQIVDYH